MSEDESIKKIVAPFVAHGVCKDEAEALVMLARDYAERQVRRYSRRAEHYRSIYQTTVEQFARQVAALAQGAGQIPSLDQLERREGILRAEDDLEEWEAAESFLARWLAIEADLPHAPAA